MSKAKAGYKGPSNSQYCEKRLEQMSLMQAVSGVDAGEFRPRCLFSDLSHVNVGTRDLYG